jgi:hypothetical protein
LQWPRGAGLHPLAADKLSQFSNARFQFTRVLREALVAIPYFNSIGIRHVTAPSSENFYRHNTFTSLFSGQSFFATAVSGLV